MLQKINPLTQTKTFDWVLESFELLGLYQDHVAGCLAVEVIDPEIEWTRKSAFFAVWPVYTRGDPEVTRAPLQHGKDWHEISSHDPSLLHMLARKQNGALLFK